VRSFRPVVLGVVCLGITGPGVGWAEPAHVGPHVPLHADWVEDPYEPHDTRGTTVRLGSSVGFLHGEPLDVQAIGATTAVGQRFGRFTIEAEFDWLALRENGQRSLIGDAERLGVLGRFDVVRLGPRWVGRNSMLALYVEAGAAVAWNHWYQPALNQPMHAVPDDTKRVEGQLGFGLLLDHRLEQPTGFPHRVGWFLGWRLAMLPTSIEPAPVCRSTTTACRASQPMPATPEERPTERSLLFQSSLAMTW
jgi:hypothetical protein